MSLRPWFRGRCRAVKDFSGPLEFIWPPRDAVGTAVTGEAH